MPLVVEHADASRRRTRWIGDRAAGQRDRRARRSPPGSTARPARRPSGRSTRCSFVVSAALLWLARPRVIEPAPQRGRAAARSASGFRYVMSVPWIWTGIASATVILMIAMSPYIALLPRIVPIALRPRRRLLRAPLQPDGGRDGRRLAALRALEPAPEPRDPICFAAFGINDVGMVVSRSHLVPARVSPPSSGAASGSASAISAWTTMLTRARAGELPLARLQPRLLRLVRADARRLRVRGRARRAVFTPAPDHRRRRGARCVMWFIPLALAEGAIRSMMRSPASILREAARSHWSAPRRDPGGRATASCATCSTPATA